MLVKEAMRKPCTIDKDMSLSEAAKIMSSRGIGSLVFVSKEKIEGIITERDLLKNFGKGGSVAKVMTRKVVTVDPDEELEEALNLMKTNKVKRLPAVRDKKVVGMISLTDIAVHSDEIGESFFF